jgi:hypothetical protein
MTAERTCDLPPFLSPVVAQIATLEQAGSSLEILTQTLENYLAALKAAVCDDLTQIVEECCGGSGASSFLALTDTPDSYAGSGGFNVTVNVGETALVFTPPPTLIDEFIELTDVPGTYAGSGGLAVAVNLAETGLEFVSFPVIPPPPTYFLTPRLIAMWPPNVTPGQFGPAPTPAGAGQIQIPANPANALTANYRQGFTATGANAVAGLRANVLQAIVGSASPMGGFRLRWRFGIETYAAGARCWIGMFATNGFPAGNTDPSAAVNCIWLGFDDTDTNWQIMHNDNAGTCTKIDLQAAFAINATSLLELTIDLPPSGTTFDYLLRDLSNGTETSGTTAGGDLPAAGTGLIMLMQIGAAATGISPRVSHIFMSLEVGPGG